MSHPAKELSTDAAAAGASMAVEPHVSWQGRLPSHLNMEFSGLYDFQLEDFALPSSTSSSCAPSHRSYFKSFHPPIGAQKAGQSAFCDHATNVISQLMPSSLTNLSCRCQLNTDKKSFWFTPLRALGLKAKPYQILANVGDVPAAPSDDDSVVPVVFHFPRPGPSPDAIFDALTIISADKRYSDESEELRLLRAYFHDRPVWSQHALMKEFEPSFHPFLLANVHRVARMHMTGAWRFLWVRKRYNPLEHRESLQFQMIELKRMPAAFLHHGVSFPDIHAFKHPPKVTAHAYQFCDIEDEEIVAMLRSIQPLRECKKRTLGWLSLTSFTALLNTMRARCVEWENELRLKHSLPERAKSAKKRRKKMRVDKNGVELTEEQLEQQRLDMCVEENEEGVFVERTFPEEKATVDKGDDGGVPGHTKGVASENKKDNKIDKEKDKEQDKEKDNEKDKDKEGQKGQSLIPPPPPLFPLTSSSSSSSSFSSSFSRIAVSDEEEDEEEDGSEKEDSVGEEEEDVENYDDDDDDVCAVEEGEEGEEGRILKRARADADDDETTMSAAEMTNTMLNGGQYSQKKAKNG